MKVSVDGAGSQAHTSIPMFRDKVANSSRFAATPAELEVDVQRQVFDYPGFQLWSSVWDVPLWQAFDCPELHRGSRAHGLISRQN
jgi:hypothetical protein